MVLISRAVVGSIIVVGVQINCALFHSVFDSKSSQINVQRMIILELMLYEDEMANNVVEAAKHMWCTYGAVKNYYSTVNTVPYLPTPPLGQDMTQGQFLSRVYQV